MNYKAIDYFSTIDEMYELGMSHGDNICDVMREITDMIPVHEFPVSEKVALSTKILGMLSKEQRKELAIELLNEQVLLQRNKLRHWSAITAQSSQIDTGYMAQHLVSLQTQITGQGMRGKGDDLCDGSEVKSANFIGSLDKKGAKGSRWDFTASTPEIMERFLEYPSVYLLSMDLNTEHKLRIRIWKIDVNKHTILRDRYIEWMNKLGYPKFNSSEKKGVNFQLFPPKSGSDVTYARHGSGKTNGLPKLQIPLENVDGAELIFRADEIDDSVVISKF